MNFSQTKVLDLTTEDAKPESVSVVGVGYVMWLEVTMHPSLQISSSNYQANLGFNTEVHKAH